MEKKNGLLVGAVVVVAIAVLVFVYMQKSKLDTGTEGDNIPAWSETPAVGRSAETPLSEVQERVITAKHAFKSGKHTVAGEIEVPTPCHVLDAQATPSADGKKIFLELASSVKTGEMCAQVITAARFKVTAIGVSDAVWSATYNGEPVRLNLIEAGPNENLDNFDLFIKG